MYIDDILVSGKTEEDQIKTLDEVLTKLKKEGLLRLKRDTSSLQKVFTLLRIKSEPSLKLQLHTTTLISRYG